MTNANDTSQGFHVTQTTDLSQRHQDWLEEHGLRTLQGSFYTPFDVVESLIEIAIGHKLAKITNLESCPKVIDPACGTGNFLIIVALRIVGQLVSNGFDEAVAIDFVIRNCIFGTDIDESALRQCSKNLSDLSGGKVKPAEIRSHLLCRDALLIDEGATDSLNQISLFDLEPEKWSRLFPSVYPSEAAGFDIVIGNPPFLSQLSTETVASKSQYTGLESRYGNSIGKLTNTASIFFLAALKMAKETATITFIQPMSFLATRDSEPIRRRIADTKSLSSIWVCEEQVFDANVQTVAITLDLGEVNKKVKIYSDRSFTYVGETTQFQSNEATWSRAMTTARRFPNASLQSNGLLRDIATITGDFRDQYYGLINAVTESSCPTAKQMKLATVGLIDPGMFSWGKTGTRFAKKPFTFPVVNLESLEPKMKVWAESRRSPKVIVATQTRVLECYVDESGEILPSIPLATINSEPDLIWHIAAMISAPPISLIAAERHFGAGMSADVLKLGAPDLLNLPLPLHKEPWDLASEEFRILQKSDLKESRRASAMRIGQLMCDAYGVSNTDVLNWWLERLPRSM